MAQRSKISTVDKASELIGLYGNDAYEWACLAAKDARNRREQKLARQYTEVSIRIAELIGKPVTAAKRLQNRQRAR